MLVSVVSLCIVGSVIGVYPPVPEGVTYEPAFVDLLKWVKTQDICMQIPVSGWRGKSVNYLSNAYIKGNQECVARNGQLQRDVRDFRRGRCNGGTKPICREVNEEGRTIFRCCVEIDPLLPVMFASRSQVSIYSCVKTALGEYKNQLATIKRKRQSQPKLYDCPPTGPRWHYGPPPERYRPNPAPPQTTPVPSGRSSPRSSYSTPRAPPQPPKPPFNPPPRQPIQSNVFFVDPKEEGTGIRTERYTEIGESSDAKGTKSYKKPKQKQRPPGPGKKPGPIRIGSSKGS